MLVASSLYLWCKQYTEGMPCPEVQILSALHRILAVPNKHVFWIVRVFIFPETFLMLFSIPFLMVPSAPITMGIASVFIFYILHISLFQDLYICLSFPFIWLKHFITRYSHVYQLASWIHFILDYDIRSICTYLCVYLYALPCPIALYVFQRWLLCPIGGHSTCLECGLLLHVCLLWGPGEGVSGGIANMSITLHYTALHYIRLHYTALHYIRLH